MALLFHVVSLHLCCFCIHNNPYTRLEWKEKVTCTTDTAHVSYYVCLLLVCWFSFQAPRQFRGQSITKSHVNQYTLTHVHSRCLDMPSAPCITHNPLYLSLPFLLLNLSSSALSCASRSLGRVIARSKAYGIPLCLPLIIIAQMTNLLKTVKCPHNEVEFVG